MPGETTTLEAAPKPAADIREYVDYLRESLRGRGPVQIDGLMETLSAAADQVLRENLGMADELICVYEQLGVVFQVTRRLPEMLDERQILELFAENLRRSFAQRELVLARRTATGWKLGGTIRPVSPWIADLLTRAAARKSVLIETPPQDAMRDDTAEVLAGPIYSGDSLVCQILFFRNKLAPAFRSGEMLLVDSLATFCGDLVRSHRLLLEMQQMSVAMVRALVNAVDQKDEYTCGHSLRVAYYADMLGRRLDLSAADMQMLQWSALLHDVGKIGIRDGVLKKEGQLTPDEMQHIREHPVRSYRIVQEIPQLAKALDGILYHHERYDGSGYPTKLAGEQIPLQARIVQIADVFDALTSNRSYRRAYTWEASLDIMAKEAGIAIDPHLQGVFDGLIRREMATGSDAWERLTRRANKFTPSVSGEPGRCDGGPNRTEGGNG